MTVDARGWPKRFGIVALTLCPLAVGYACSIPVCPSALFFDHACPGCGLTRATVALFQGDFARAISLQPLAPLACPILIGVLAVAMFTYIKHGQMKLPGWLGWPVAATALALNLVWVMRLFGAFGGLPPV